MIWEVSPAYYRFLQSKGIIGPRGQFARIVLQLITFRDSFEDQQEKLRVMRELWNAGPRWVEPALIKENDEINA